MHGLSQKYSDKQKLQEIINDFSDEIEIKSVFAIRSDRLSELNALSDKIPDIQEVFYELKPLSYEQIKEAVTLPALEQGNYEANAFNFDNDAIEKIIYELQDEKTKEIETTQLQIVCQQIEDIAIIKQSVMPSDVKSQTQKNTISVSDLPKFEAVFFNFYQNSINKLPEKIREAAKRLIEDELIRNNVRISLDEEVCKLKISKENLEILVNTHLLRADRNNFGRFSYEVSHDTLVPPISEAREKYLTKIEEEKAEAERLQELKKAQGKAEFERIEREKESKKQRTIIIIVSIAAIISVGFAIFGFWQMNKAKSALKVANEKTIIAEEQTEIANEAFLKIRSSFIKEAYLYLDAGEYKVAKEKFIYIRDSIAGGDTSNAIIKEIELCKFLETEKIKFDSLDNLGDLALNNDKNYNLAVEYYSKALETEITTGKETVVVKLKEIKTEIDKTARQYRTDASVIGGSYAANYNYKASKLEELSDLIDELIDKYK